MATARQTFLPAADTADAWVAALAKLYETDANFDAHRPEFNQAERDYWAVRDKSADDPVAIASEAAAKARMEEAQERQGILVDALHNAAVAFYHTPSPDLASAIRKVELIEEHGFDGRVEPLIAADLRQLLAQQYQPTR